MIERIKKIMLAENMSQGKFADEIGIINSRLSHYLSGRNNVSLDLVERILERFRGVNPEWLLFGRGEMYKTGEVIPASNSYQERDLFSSVQSNDSKTEQTEIPSENPNSDKPEDEIKHSQTVEEAGFTSKNASQISGTQPNEIAKTTLKSKLIEKIIVMYSDNSFDCYLPNGKRM